MAFRVTTQYFLLMAIGFSRLKSMGCRFQGIGNTSRVSIVLAVGMLYLSVWIYNPFPVLTSALSNLKEVDPYVPYIARWHKSVREHDLLTGRAFSLKIVDVIGPLMIAGLMVLGFVANNLWHWLPEFHTLDSVAAFSPYLQIPLLLLVIVVLFAALFGRRILLWFLFPAALLCCLSWYSVRLSNAENAIIFGVVPLISSKVHFSEIETVRFEGGSLVLEPGKRVIPMPPKFLGFDNIPVVNELQSYGDCLQKVQSACREIRFVWP